MGSDLFFNLSLCFNLFIPSQDHFLILMMLIINQFHGLSLKPNGLIHFTNAETMVSKMASLKNSKT